MLDAADGVISDVGERVAPVSLGVDAVELCGAEEGVEIGSTDGAANAPISAANQWQGRGLDPTALRERAYARSYDNADERATHLPHWLRDYNWHRPSASVDYRTPMSAFAPGVNDVLGLYG